MMKTLQRGQALPLGLALALVGMLGALVLYNTGRVATDKARLANAADAAAYSGLLWQARAMNFQAYTNRAMIANQVSIAQAVSLRSWTDYGAQTSGNIADILSVVPPMKVYAEGVATVMETLDRFLGPVAEAMVDVIAGINGAIATSQEAMHVSAFLATPDITNAIAAGSDERFRANSEYATAGLAANFAEWHGFTERHDASAIAPMKARTQLVNDSLDDFSRARNWKLFDGFWFYSTPVTRHKMFREGKTRLVTVERGGELAWEWKAVDTLSLQTRIFRPLKSEKKQEVPIGWGAAKAGAREGSASLSDGACSGFGPTPEWAACGAWTANGTAERQGFDSMESMGGYEGLHAFRSLSADTLEAARVDGAPTVVRLRTEITMDTSDVRASGTFVAGERLRADVAAPGDVLSSVSAAELYYRRPDDARDATELSDQGASGYNPYWTVRLAPVTTGERLVALGLRGGGGTVAPREAGAGGGPLAAFDADAPTAGVDPSAAASSALPDYAATLASAWEESPQGIELAALDRRVSESLDLGRRGIESFQNVGDAAGEIRDSVRDKLEGAVGDIMAGATRDAANAARSTIGDAVGAAEDAFDSALPRVIDAAGAVVDGADRLVEGAEGTLESAEDRFLAARDMALSTGEELGVERLGGLDVGAYEDRLSEKVEEARRYAQHMEDVRVEVARRMDEAAPLIRQMALERVFRRDFDDDFLAPRAYRGYDFRLLHGIVELMTRITFEVDPELPPMGVMIVEGSKPYYTEHVDAIRREGPLAGLEPEDAGDEKDGEGHEDEKEEGEGDGEPPVVVQPYEEGEITEWETIYDEVE